MIDEKAGEDDDEDDDNIVTTPEESSSSTETQQQQQQPNSAITDSTTVAVSPSFTDDVKPIADDVTKTSDGSAQLLTDTSTTDVSAAGSSVSVKIEQQQQKMETSEVNVGNVDGAKPTPSLEQLPDDKKDVNIVVKNDIKLENYDDINNKRQVKIVTTDVSKNTQQGEQQQQQQQQQAPMIAIIKSSNPSDIKGGDGTNAIRLVDNTPQPSPTQSNVQLIRSPSSSGTVNNGGYSQQQQQGAMMPLKQQPPNIVVVKTEEEKQGRQQQHQQQQQQQQQQGTSKIIIHDPNSLNKLFPPTGPAHQYQQYGPTLSSTITPQKLNEGVSDVFSSKNPPPSNIQQHPSSGSNMSSLVISRLEDGGSAPNSNKISLGTVLPPPAGVSHANSITASLPLPKAVLSSKPSLEIKHLPHSNTNFDIMNSSAKVLAYGDYFPVNQSPSALATAVSHYHTSSVELHHQQQLQSRAGHVGHVMSPRDMKLMEEKIDDSDTEADNIGEDQSRTSNASADINKSSKVSPPGTILTMVHEIYPMKDVDRTVAPAIIASPPIVDSSVHHHQQQLQLQQQQQQLLVSGATPFKLNTIHTTLATVPSAAPSFALSLRPLGGAQQQQQQGQKGFENALMSRDLSSKLSSEAANFNLFQGKHQPPQQQQQQNGRIHQTPLRSIGIPPSGSGGDNKSGQPTSLTLLPATGVDHHRNNASSMEVKSNTLNISSNNPNNGPGSEVTKTTSLLHQRLLSPDPSISNNQPGGGVKLPPAKAPQFHPGGDRGVGGEYRLNPADKLSVTTSLTLTSSTPRVPEKSKLGLPGAGGLRINPPPDERSNVRMSSHPDGPVGPNSQYRAPLGKGLSMGDIAQFPALVSSSSMGIPPSSSGGIDNQRKMLLSRTTSNIAIAPAPSTVISSRGVDLTPTGSAVDYVHAAEGN